MILASVLPPETAVPAGADFPIPATVAAVVSVAVFWLGQVITRRNARQERQRQVIESWFRTLSKWVDEFGSKDSNPDYSPHAITSRQIIELSLTRRNRFLAWWMHEMALAVVERRKESGKSWQAGRNSLHDLERLLTEAGEPLLAWHHGKLRSSDFHIPYKLRAEARVQGKDVDGFAKELGLQAYVSPKRMTYRRSWQYQQLILNPKTGGPIVDTLEYFTGRRHVTVAYALLKIYLFFTWHRLPIERAKVVLTHVRVGRSERRLAKSNHRLLKAEARELRITGNSSGDRGEGHVDAATASADDQQTPSHVPANE
ncbi:hypothetical protein [Paenarthrobacter sp. NPDC089316]|uniref:hypothetical protein n=1 Tax=unclassified Paenarthrobacter TaxID=2634190 RepID=UPI003442EA58